MTTKKLSVVSLYLVCGMLLPPPEPARSSLSAPVRTFLDAGVDPCEPDSTGMFCVGDCTDPGLQCVPTEVTKDADGNPFVTKCECIDECHVDLDPDTMKVRCVNFCPDPTIPCELKSELVGGVIVHTCVCEPATCQVVPICEPLADADCQSDDPTQNCRPLCVERVDDGAGGLVLVAAECSCISPNDPSCGPVTVVPLPPPEEGFNLRCDGACDSADETCQVLLDGVATGLPDINSSDVPVGSQVCCDCVVFPPPECPEPAGQTICEDLQEQQCLSDDQNTTCEPLCVTIEGVGGVLTPVAKLCDCIADDSCGPVDVMPINDPPSDYALSCLDVCDVGELCEVFIDGHATGEVSVNASDVPVGSQVCCDCAPDPPLDVCPLPPNDFLCEDLQAVDCVEDQTGEFCQASCVDYDPMGGAVAVATQCECGLPGDCHVVLDAAGQPSCEGTCADGTPCVPTEKDNPDDGTIEFCCGCCPTNDLRLDLTTGVDDDTGGLIAIGLDDDTWTVTCEPPSGDPLPRPAKVIATHPAWAILPGSRWISANTTGPNGDYCYETCFCLDERARNPNLTLQLLADDQAFVFVNGLFLGQTPSPGFLAPTLLMTNDETLFRPGETNCITVVVANQFGVVTGFNLVGSLTVENGECCCGPTDDGSACEDVDCPVDTEECQPRCMAIDPLSQEVTVEDCECRAEDECHPVVMPGADPKCVGSCPNGEECVETLIHDDNGVVIGICCDCEPQLGACCFDVDDGPLVYDTCQDDVTETECIDAGGVFQGVGSECTIEACCLPGGFCQDADPDCCLASMGQPQGLGTNCGNTDCPEQTGACCDGTTGICEDDVPESDCPVGCFGECIGGGYCDDPDCCVDPDNCPVCYEPNSQISIKLCGDCFGECMDGSYCDHPDPNCCVGDACQCFPPNHPVSIDLCGECFGECIDGSYCDSSADPDCCVEPANCPVCYSPSDPISIKLCGNLPDPDNQYRWEKGLDCLELDPPCEEHIGACCDGTTGTCEDDVPESACSPPPGIFNFQAVIDGAQNNNCNGTGSAGTGTGLFTLDTATGSVSFNITFSGLGSPETQSHVHGAAPECLNAGIVYPLPLGSPKIGVAVISAARMAEMINGLHYVNIHTQQFPAGEIRGQILLLPDESQFRWEKDTLCADLDPPCEEHTGACCDGTTGDCADNVPESECPTAEIPPGIGTCENEAQCNEPCPAIGACITDSDCGPGGMCLPDCVPSFCTCDQGQWACTDDCNGQCAAVPNQNRWEKDTLCSDLDPPCEEHTGACCDEGNTGECIDHVPESECQFERWEKDTLCSELDPPCTGECGPCPTDVNHDGFTEALDLGNTLGCWSGEDPCEPLEGVCICLDVDGDGCIGALELAVTLGSWGACCRDGLCLEGESCDDCALNDSGFPNECASETWCADGVDNDCDGLTDCDDPDCTGDPNCP